MKAVLPPAISSSAAVGVLRCKLAPVRRRSTEIINYIARATNGRLPIIGVGGIMDEAAAGEKLDAGATLVQLYTGLIYRGPFFAAEIARALAERQRG